MQTSHSIPQNTLPNHILQLFNYLQTAGSKQQTHNRTVWLDILLTDMSMFWAQLL